MRRAADSIGDFLAGLDANAYEESELVRSAVERKFEIIGEALAQLAKLEPALAARIPGFRAIIAFRNLLIHGYAAVDPQHVLSIARTDLPQLAAVVDELLEQLSD
jgi:uncharacterized protein with HEPN domain